MENELTDQPSRLSCELKFEDILKQRKIIEEDLQRLKTSVQEFDQVEQNRSNVAALMNHQESTEEQRIMVDQTFAQMANTCLDKFQKTLQIVMRNLEDLYKSLGNLIRRLIEEVEYWQRQLALKYSELAADVNIDNVAQWAADTGKCLQDILQINIPHLEKAISAVQGSGDSVCEPIREKFHKLLVSLLRRTFVVTEQTRWNVKTGKSCTTQTPEIKLRILGADALDILDGVEIQTCFVLENHINECYNKDSENLDFDTLKEKSWKFKGQTSKFEKGQNYKAIGYEGIFYSIEMKATANRKKTVPVFMEKYRFVFSFKMENNTLWTMSMPLVVTTGSVQDCQCLASVMWQCFSTNSFAIPVEPVTDLPWTTIAEMLQSKIANLPSTRKLSEDNLQHLKERLTWNIEDDGKISLQQFCNVPLIRNTSTPPEQVLFWQWFLSLYNLIRTDIGGRNLLEYWNNGWIEGFISTEMAEKKLQGCARGKHGMFLLRFSDWSIKESQSKSGVMGKLVLSVLIKCNGTSKKVQHIGPVKGEELKNQPLASYILSLKDGSGKKICHYLYSHSEVHIDVLFRDPTNNSEPPHHGYVPIVNIPTIELEKGFSKLELGEKRSASSPDLEDVKNCITKGGIGIAESKRLKNGYCDPMQTLTQSQVKNQHADTKSVDTPMLKALLTPHQRSSGVTKIKVVAGNVESEHFVNKRTETFDVGLCDSGNKNHSDQIPTVVFDNFSITETSKSSADILMSPDSRIFDRAISSETPAGGSMHKPQINNTLPPGSSFIHQLMPGQIAMNNCSIETFIQDAQDTIPLPNNSTYQLSDCQLNLVRPVSGSGQNTVPLPYQPNLSVADCQSKLVIPVSETTYENHGLTNNIGGHIYQQTNVDTNSEQDFSIALDQAGPDLTNVNTNSEQNFPEALDQTSPDLIDKGIITYLRNLPVGSKQEIIKMLQEDVNESQVAHGDGKEEETIVPWDDLDTELESFQDLDDFVKFLENDND